MALEATLLEAIALEAPMIQLWLSDLDSGHSSICSLGSYSARGYSVGGYSVGGYLQ